jgi:hypothetical protein
MLKVDTTLAVDHGLQVLLIAVTVVLVGTTMRDQVVLVVQVL